MTGGRDLEQRRRALIDEAAELGLTVITPTPYQPEPVYLRLEGRPRDVETVIDLLTVRGIVLDNRTESRATSGGREQTQFVLSLTSPGNDPMDEPPPGRVLWKPGDDMMPWEATLLRWDDPSEPLGSIARPWPDTPPEESLPVPLLDERGREIGQVLQARATDDGLLVSGLVAASQLHAVMRDVVVDSIFRVRACDNGSNWSRSTPKQLITPWKIPAVRLISSPYGHGHPIRVTGRFDDAEQSQDEKSTPCP